jgi:hypothetical protein
MKECRVTNNAQGQICACVFVHICIQTHAAKTKKTFAIQQPELQYAALNLNRHIIYPFYYYSIEIFLRMLSNISIDVKKDSVYIQELELKRTFRL